MTSENTIIVCASAGGLARQLAALLDYALNPVETPDFLQRVDAEHLLEDPVYLSEWLRPKLAPRNTNDSITAGSNDRQYSVLHTSQTSSELLTQYPSAKIIEIVSTATDKLQMATNYIVEDCWHTTAQLVDLDMVWEQAKITLGMPDADYVEIFQDPQYRDNELLLVLIMILAGSPSFCTPRQANGANSDQYLAVDFAQLCPAGDQAYKAETAFSTIFNFIKPTQYKLDQLFDLWKLQLGRLNNTDQMQLNTANWSN